MSREYNLYLRDILEAIERIERYTRGMDYEEFTKNDLIQDGVIRNLTVIGEAVKLIPESLKCKPTPLSQPTLPQKKTFVTPEPHTSYIEERLDV